MDEYGRLDQQTEEKESKNPKAEITTTEGHKDTGGDVTDAALMQVEERNTGAVTWNTYTRYLTYAGGVVWVPIILGLLLLDEAARGV